jgi:mycofactocin precursor
MEQDTTVIDADRDEEIDAQAEAELEDELLIEEISIDGMCGVY